MKNVKLFCQMAIHIKTVKKCNVSVSGIYYADKADEYPCCFIGSIHRKGIGNFSEDEAYHLSRSNLDEQWKKTFGVQPHHELLFPEARLEMEIVAGMAYYEECVKFLKRHKVLPVLRRMENQAKAA